MRGESKEAPIWALTLTAAEEWGMAPWRVEEEATAEWWGRWLAWREERSAARRKGRK